MFNQPPTDDVDCRMIDRNTQIMKEDNQFSTDVVTDKSVTINMSIVYQCTSSENHQKLIFSPFSN